MDIKHLGHCYGHQTHIWGTVMGIRQTPGPLLWASDKHLGHCYVPSVRSSCYSVVGLLDYCSSLLLIIFVFFNMTITNSERSILSLCTVTALLRVALRCPQTGIYFLSFHILFMHESTVCTRTATDSFRCGHEHTKQLNRVLDI
jgi:hypothetical protein